MAADLSGIVIAPPTRRAKAAGLYRKLKRLPIIPLSILGLVVFAGLFAPLLAPHDPEKGELRERNMPPAWSGGETALKTVVERLSINERTTSVTLIDAQEIDASAQLGDQIVVFTRPAGSSKFLLGTDHLGRDVLSRVIYGARISLLVSIVTLAVGGSIGITMGLVAGYYGGFIDEFLMRLVDIKLAIPLILIALVRAGNHTGSIALDHRNRALLVYLAKIRPPGPRRSLATKAHGLCVLGKSFRRLDSPNSVHTHLPWDDQHAHRGVDPPGRYRDSAGVDPQFLGRRSAAAHACLGFHGRRRPRQASRWCLVDLHLPRRRNHADGYVIELVRRLAPGHSGSALAPIGVT